MRVLGKAGGVGGQGLTIKTKRLGGDLNNVISRNSPLAKDEPRTAGEISITDSLA
jgi:hypothetical protein